MEDYFLITKIGSESSKETWTGAENRCQNFKTIFKGVMKIIIFPKIQNEEKLCDTVLHSWKSLPAK